MSKVLKEIFLSTWTSIAFHDWENLRSGYFWWYSISEQQLRKKVWQRSTNVPFLFISQLVTLRWAAICKPSTSFFWSKHQHFYVTRITFFFSSWHTCALLISKENLFKKRVYATLKNLFLKSLSLGNASARFFWRHLTIKSTQLNRFCCSF